MSLHGPDDIQGALRANDALARHAGAKSDDNSIMACDGVEDVTGVQRIARDKRKLGLCHGQFPRVAGKGYDVVACLEKFLDGQMTDAAGGSGYGDGDCNSPVGSGASVEIDTV